MRDGQSAEAYLYFASVFLEDAKCVAKSGVGSYNVTSITDAGYCSQFVSTVGDDHPATGLHSTAYFAAGHAIELLLKAHLLWKGWSEAQIKDRIGHDLAKALEEAEKLGLNFGLGAYIVSFSDYHKRQLFRYPQGPRLTMPSVEDLIDLAEQLKKRIQKEGIREVGFKEQFKPRPY